MKIEILGMGCRKCDDLYSAAQEAAAELGISAEVVKVKDFREIAKYGVMTTPALAVDGVVKAAGKALSKDEIKKLLE